MAFQHHPCRNSIIALLVWLLIQTCTHLNCGEAIDNFRTTLQGRKPKFYTFHNMASSTAPRVPVPNPLPRPVPRELRSLISQHLLDTGTIANFHATLLHHAQASGWIDALKQRSLELLRSGDCSTYGDVMKAIMEEAKSKQQGTMANGVTGDKRNGAGKNGLAGIVGGPKTDVKIPEVVTERGFEALRKTLEGVVDIVGEE